MLHWTKMRKNSRKNLSEFYQILLLCWSLKLETRNLKKYLPRCLKKNIIEYNKVNPKLILNRCLICRWAGNLKGGIGWGVYWIPCEFYLMFLSREIEKKLFKYYTKIVIYQMLYRNSRFKQVIFSKYATNLKRRYPRGA